MPTVVSTETLERAFEVIVQCALAGERCPATARKGQPGLPKDATRDLARAGRIRIEVYSRNWRVVTILTGEHAGKHTQMPKSGKPYRLIDKSGTFELGRGQQRAA